MRISDARRDISSQQCGKPQVRPCVSHSTGGGVWRCAVNHDEVQTTPRRAERALLSPRPCVMTTRRAAAAAQQQQPEACALPPAAATTALQPHWTEDAASVEEMMGIGRPVAAAMENLMGQLMQPLDQNGNPVRYQPVNTQAMHRSASAPTLLAPQHIPHPQPPMDDRGLVSPTSEDDAHFSSRKRSNTSSPREQLTEGEKQARRCAAA